MVDDILSFGFRELRVKQGAPAPLGKFFTAGAAAQQSNVIMAVYFADAQIALASVTKALAFRIDTG
jgi:hypothetical protein